MNTAEIPQIQRREGNPITVLSGMRWDMNEDAPIVLCGCGEDDVIVSHQVQVLEERVSQWFRSKLSTLIWYVWLWFEDYALSLTLRWCVGDTLSFVVPNLENRQTYLDSLTKKLDHLEGRLRLIVPSTLPLWIGLDAGTSWATPPLTETIVGTLAAYIASKLWLRKIQRVRRLIQGWAVHFEEDQSLQETEQLLMVGDHEAALHALDDSDGIPDNNLFTPEKLHLAEQIGIRFLADREWVKARTAKALAALKEQLRVGKVEMESYWFVRATA